MTFSIVAYDPATASWGVAVASKCLAVGHVVPWGAAGKGAIATQALANVAYGPEGLALLDNGCTATEAISALVADDALASRRQVGLVDGSGRADSFTGSDCLPWCGGIVDGEIAVQGNLLVGGGVVEAMVAAYREGASASFESRLLRALQAGDAAGGDRRGRQSAAMRIWRAGASYGGTLDIALDLRVDDHVAPAEELARLEQLHLLYFRRSDPSSLLELDESLIDEVAARLASIGYASDAPGGFPAALERWVGTENFEERHVPGKIDPLVLDHLRRQSEPTG